MATQLIKVLLMVKGEHQTNILFNGILRLKDIQYGRQFANKINVKALIGNQALKALKRSLNGGDGELTESKIIDSMGKILFTEKIA